jgi:hypothetical protein
MASAKARSSGWPIWYTLPTSLQNVCRAHFVPLALWIGYPYQIAHDWRR